MPARRGVGRLFGGLPAVLLGMVVLAGVPAGAAAVTAPVDAPAGPHLEDMTWTELRDRIDHGATTVLVPIGGTEQNGPHIALGKHNVRVRVLAARIAERLGNAVVAPVIAYVPEGGIDPPTAHMRFAGTISISDAAFESLLEATARSLRRHGFRDVVFLGDHGGTQPGEERVAAKLNREWTAAAAKSTARVHALVEYYRASQTAYVDALKARGFGPAQIGSHAGLADTALTLAVAPSLVRRGAMAGRDPSRRDDGVAGDPRLATAELGQLGVDRIIEASVARIRMLAAPR